MSNVIANRGLANRWIFNAPIDLMMCCGGLVWFLFLAHRLCALNPSFQHTVDALTLIGALGTIFMGETHAIATMARIYKDESTEQKLSFYTHWLPLALLAVALLACQQPFLGPLLVKLYLLLIAYHFTAQTYGIIILYCLKQNYVLSAVERWMLKGLMRSTTGFAIARQCTFRQWSGDNFLGQQVPFWGPLPIWIYNLVTVIFITSILMVVMRIGYRYVCQGQLFPLPALLLMVTGVSIFMVGKDITQSLWLYVPAFFHGSQYLVITTFAFLKEEGLTQGVAPWQMAELLGHRKTLRYWGLLLLGAIAVFTGVPRLLQQFGCNYSLAVVAIFTTVQLHHIITDGAIWRLRSGQTRTGLL